MVHISHFKPKLRPEEVVTAVSRNLDPSNTQNEEIPVHLFATSVSSSNTPEIVQPLPLSRAQLQQRQHQPVNERWTESPQREIVEITSSLTINNLSKYTALARAKRKLLFIARKTDQNYLALHSLKGDGKATPEVIMLKDNQVRALTPNEAKHLLDNKS